MYRSQRYAAPATWRGYVVLEVARQAAQGLAALHEAGVARLDIKPPDLLVARPIITGQLDGPATPSRMEAFFKLQQAMGDLYLYVMHPAGVI